MGKATPTEEPADPYPVRAKQLLKARALWLMPAVVGGTVFVLITIFYIGSVVDPAAHLGGLPVSIVDEDVGATVGSHRLDLGARVEAGLTGSPAVTTRLALTPETLAAAERRMDRNGAYATLVIPRSFTASLLSLAGAAVPASAHPGKPTIQLLGNRRSGSVGVQLADGVLEPAIAKASHQVGHTLLLAGRRSAGRAAPAAVLADPITLERADYRPLPSHSGLGLSAFYIALLTLICGFLAATIVNATVDVATGYATSETGPRWRQRAPLPIDRWQTLLAKWALVVPLTALMTGLMLAVAAGLLGMDAPNIVELWLFTWLAAASVAVGTIVLFATLGAPGQLVALLVFVYLGLASAGGTVPLEALPSSLRLVSEFEPLRQILAGTRSILYFDAAGDAGLTRGIVAASAGLVFWLVLGAAVVRWYDRKGLHRLKPDVLAYVSSAISSYGTDASPKAPAREGGAPGTNV